MGSTPPIPRTHQGPYLSDPYAISFHSQSQDKSFDLTKKISTLFPIFCCLQTDSPPDIEAQVECLSAKNKRHSKQNIAFPFISNLPAEDHNICIQLDNSEMTFEQILDEIKFISHTSALPEALRQLTKKPCTASEKIELIKIIKKQFFLIQKNYPFEVRFFVFKCALEANDEDLLQGLLFKMDDPISLLSHCPEMSADQMRLLADLSSNKPDVAQSKKEILSAIENIESKHPVLEMLIPLLRKKIKEPLTLGASTMTPFQIHDVLEMGVGLICNSVLDMASCILAAGNSKWVGQIQALFSYMSISSYVFLQGWHENNDQKIDYRVYAGLILFSIDEAYADLIIEIESFCKKREILRVQIMPFIIREALIMNSKEEDRLTTFCEVLAHFHYELYEYFPDFSPITEPLIFNGEMQRVISELFVRADHIVSKAEILDERLSFLENTMNSKREEMQFQEQENFSSSMLDTLSTLMVIKRALHLKSILASEENKKNAPFNLLEVLLSFIKNLSIIKSLFTISQPAIDKAQAVIQELGAKNSIAKMNQEESVNLLSETLKKEIERDREVFTLTFLERNGIKLEKGKATYEDKVILEDLTELEDEWLTLGELEDAGLYHRGETAHTVIRNILIHRKKQKKNN